MKNVFFTSDTHYNHANIVKGTTSWDNHKRCRDFATLDEHNATLVENINKVVGENDELYHLGDWSFGGKQAISDFRSRLNCGNIHLILGNHDHHIERNTDNLRSLFHSVSHYKEISVASQKIILCHYAMRVWNLSHKGSWMLYGHSHGTLPNYRDDEQSFDNMKDIFYKTMDVGIDTHENFRPYHFDEIVYMMRNRVNLNVDHHNSNTN